MNLLGLVVKILAAGAFAFAKPPSWFKDNTKLAYPRYSVTCAATGPSLHQARQLAIGNCKSSAMDQLPTRTKFQSVIVETDEEVALHSESTTEAIVKNLTCNHRHEETEESESSFTVYLLCDFDLSKTELVNRPLDRTNKGVSAGLNQFAEKPVDYVEPLRVPANTKSISISTAPQCRDILIRGKRSRIIRCTENPISIIFTEADTELVIRKNGFRSKTINVSEMIHSKEDSFVFPLDPF
jgi:hypothetical protein